MVVRGVNLSKWCKNILPFWVLRKNVRFAIFFFLLFVNFKLLPVLHYMFPSIHNMKLFNYYKYITSLVIFTIYIIHKIEK